MADISAAPFVADLKPYVDIIVPPIVTVLIGWAALKFQQWTGVKINQAQIEKLKSAAATEAGVLVAQAEDNLAKQKITTSSPSVVAAADRIAKSMPDAAAAVGATPEALQKFVAGEIGKLQAQAPSAPPADGAR